MIVVAERTIIPNTIGHRYPNRLSRKLTIVAARMFPRELGVRIIPLSKVDNLSADLA